jgi:hypothetical protein
MGASKETFDGYVPLDGFRYVEPANAGGSGEPVAAVFSGDFPLAPTLGSGGFFVWAR